MEEADEEARKDLKAGLLWLFSATVVLLSPPEEAGHRT